jgi:predicted glycoside hydrolase/deacetylase ChbG (UPF0249 family)
MVRRSGSVVSAVSLVLIAAAACRHQHDISRCCLVIHSDDAGFSSAVNTATTKAMEIGVVSSASIMVPLPGFPEIAEYAKKHPEKDFGVHLTLTSEKRNFRWGPILKGMVPSLVQEDGSFWRTAEEVADRANPDDVYRELCAQIDGAFERGVPVTHLDHHMWVMLQTPELLKVYVQIGVEYGLPVRLHRRLTHEECGERLNDPAQYKAIIQPAIESGNALFDLIETNNYEVSPDQKRHYYIDILRNLEPGFSELCIHCCENRLGALLPNAPDRRAADATVFTSEEIRDEIQRQGIRVVSWKELQLLNLHHQQ